MFLLFGLRSGRRGRLYLAVRVLLLVVFLVAVVEMVLRLDQIVYAPFYALFVVGPTAMLVEIWLESRRARAAKLTVAQ